MIDQDNRRRSIVLAIGARRQWEAPPLARARQAGYQEAARRQSRTQ